MSCICGRCYQTLARKALKWRDLAGRNCQPWGLKCMSSRKHHLLQSDDRTYVFTGGVDLCLPLTVGPANCSQLQQENARSSRKRVMVDFHNTLETGNVITPANEAALVKLLDLGYQVMICTWCSKEKSEGVKATSGCVWRAAADGWRRSGSSAGLWKKSTWRRKISMECSPQTHESSMVR